MSCRGCNASLNCPGDEIFPYSLTPGSEFPYVINCPENSNCSSALNITMTCCETPTTLNIPEGLSDAERAAMIQQLVAQCAFLNQGCPSGGSGGTPGDPEPPVTTYYFNQRQVGSSDCAARYGGGTFYFPVAAGSFISTSLAEANALALRTANASALSRKFCLNAPCLCPCADVAATININTVGGTRPFSYEITSGSLPTGMTLTVVGGVLRLAGTPTVSGSSSVTLKVYDQSGGWLVKTLTIYVLEITTDSLPNPIPGEPYSEQIVGTGGTGTYSFEIIDGELPEGLTMSDTGLISGTPTGSISATFTVRMRDAGLSQTTGGCEKEYEFTGASFIIYYGTDGSAPWFSPSAPLGSIMAVDLSNVPGGNDLLEGSTGGVQKIVSGKLSDGWQGGHIDPNPDGSSFESGDCSGFWNYFPRTAAGLTNKFTMRFWFRIDPFIAQELSYSSIYHEMIELESGRVQVQLDSGPNIFRVQMVWFTSGGPVNLTSADIPLDEEWHRVVVTYDPDTDEATLQIDNDTPVTDTIADVEPTDGRNAFKWEPPSGGIFDPFPQQLALAQFCEFYIADSYIWTTEERTADWNGGAGRTWPNVPGA